MGYGFSQPGYGTNVVPRMQPLSLGRNLATAAAGVPSVGDPFGLGVSPPIPVAPGPFTPPPPPKGVPQTQSPAATPPTTPTIPKAPTTAATSPVFNINTDPVLQGANASAGLSDAQAKAAADKQRRDSLLAYGSPDLVRQLLGDDTLAQAAGANPLSTLNQLAHTRDTSLQSFDSGLVPQNLAFSGYRVKGEGELGNQYQDALAQAAAGVNSNLDSINGNLNSQLGQNQGVRDQAASDAYTRAIISAIQNPPTKPPGGDGSDNSGGYDFGTATPPATPRFATGDFRSPISLGPLGGFLGLPVPGRNTINSPGLQAFSGRNRAV